MRNIVVGPAEQRARQLYRPVLCVPLRHFARRLRLAIRSPRSRLPEHAVRRAFTATLLHAGTQELPRRRGGKLTLNQRDRNESYGNMKRNIPPLGAAGSRHRPQLNDFAPRRRFTASTPESGRRRACAAIPFSRLVNPLSSTSFFDRGLESVPPPLHLALGSESGGSGRHN